jgi:hypothetical protein
VGNMQKKSWVEELISWENSHPEYMEFKEDSDSQRNLNQNERV